MSAGWKHISYKQEMPPAGGYGRIPYKRNLPVRGPSGAVLWAFGLFHFGYGYYTQMRNAKLVKIINRESKMAELVYTPLLDAEKDRLSLKRFKEEMETEALNLVGSGIDKDFKVGSHLSCYETPRWNDRGSYLKWSMTAESIYNNQFRMNYERLGP